MSRRPTPARQYATLIIMIGMISSGIAALVALAGQTNMALMVCAGGLVVAVLVLLLGGLVVAATDDDSA